MNAQTGKRRDAAGKLWRSILPRCIVISLATVVAVGVLLAAGCENGGGSDPAGTSTIQGNVSQPATGGVVVGLTNSDVGTTTDNSGYFVMTGVPAGPQHMYFDVNGTQSMLDVNVPQNGTLYLDNVQCRSPQASYGRMRTQMNDNMGPGSMSGPGSGMHDDWR